MINVRKQAIKGAQWMSISTVTTSIVQILRLSILTRFLEKSDFGIVAIITFILGLTFTFTDLGFSSAIMYKQGLTRKEFSSLFWIQLITFSILYCLLSLCSPFVAQFYNEPSITQLMPIALLDLVLQGIGRLYDTILQKEFLFKQMAIRNMTASFISLIIAFTFAFLGYGIYSLILSTLSQSIIVNSWNFIGGQKNYKILLGLDFKQSIPLMKVGMYQTGTQILDYLASKIDIAIIGKLIGTEELGIYNLAKELIYKVIILINAIVNKISVPIFAKFQEDKKKLKHYYLQIIRIVSTIDIPLLSLIVILSPSIITILYGPSFKEASTLLMIFTLWGMGVCLANPQGGLAAATGNTHLSLKYTIIRIVITVPSIFISACISTKAIAWSQGILELIMVWLGWKIQISAIIYLPFKEFCKSFNKNLYMGIISITIMLLIPNNLFSDANLIIQVTIYTLRFMALYSILFILISKDELHNVIHLFRNKKIDI